MRPLIIDFNKPINKMNIADFTKGLQNVAIKSPDIAMTLASTGLRTDINPKNINQLLHQLDNGKALTGGFDFHFSKSGKLTKESSELISKKEIRGVKTIKDLFEYMSNPKKFKQEQEKYELAELDF